MRSSMSLNYEGQRQSSATSLQRSMSGGSFSPGRSSKSLLIKQASGSNNLGRGHASWVDEKPLPQPSGQPHAGTRDEVLRAALTHYRGAELVFLDDHDRPYVNSSHATHAIWKAGETVYLVEGVKNIFRPLYRV